MVRLGEGVTFRDFFRAQKTRYSSLWGGHSAFDSVENNKQQIYSLMAVHPSQLAPTKVRMCITSDGDFRVVRLGLLELGTKMLWVGWSGLCLPVLESPVAAIGSIFGSGRIFDGI